MRILTQDDAGQRELGAWLAKALASPSVIFLDGELGTGKTTLVRGILETLGHTGPVPSPTYTLLEPYELGGMTIYHLDLYRIGDPEELEYLGLRDLYDENSVLLVEWPQRGLDQLPAPDIVIGLAHHGNGRSIELTPHTPTGSRIVQWVRAQHRCAVLKGTAGENQ